MLPKKHLNFNHKLKNMKLKLTSLLVALGLLTNAASAGNSVKIGYGSDFFYRGSQKAEESIQSSLMLSHAISNLSASAHLCSNQAIDSGLDSYHMGAGLGASFSDGLISLYGGLNRFEDKPGETLSEAEIKLSLGVPFSPSFSAYRDLSDDLYTFEAGVSYVLETSISDLALSGSVGNTETSATSDTTYYSVGAGVSKNLNDTASVGLNVDYVDADNIDNEYVWGAAITLKF